jgi:hypothetical protein
LWNANPGLERRSQVDTEVFLRLFRKHLSEGQSIPSALGKVYQEIEGVASIAIQMAEGSFVLATNNGSAYYLYSREHGIFLFASEKYILEKIEKAHPFLKVCGSIEHLDPGNALLTSFSNSPITRFGFTGKIDIPETQTGSDSALLIKDYSHLIVHEEITKTRIPGEGPYFLPETFNDIFPDVEKRVAELRRCTRCILPETMPFIEFDHEGVCNYCRSEETKMLLGLDALKKAMAPYRKDNGEPECLITFSGGRDSSYGLHFVTEVLQMKPITYTYDWGMITDLGRRNQMRMCGKLGIENILVSADIGKKRRNIRLNIQAWLKQPDLGTIPLFMAGDKQYFYYANQVGKQTGCKIIVLCENLLETTRFKTGYCGISPHFGSAHTYTLSLADKFRLLGYYGRQYLTNPDYLNVSLLDTIGAYLSYYFLPHNYLNLYEYIQWDEQVINHALKEYNWETADDTKSTWRIGDGTASFYNYIYYTMAGFTENDTFRSNQIRAGFLSRDEALNLVKDENTPRYHSIQWYCDIIGIDFESTIRRINSAPKLYQFE